MRRNVWKLLHTSIAMVLERLAVILEISGSLLYFIPRQFFPMCFFCMLISPGHSLFGLLFHAWSDRLKMGV